MFIRHIPLTAKRLLRWAMICVALALSACGGNESSTPSTLGRVVGAWEDQTSVRTTALALVLPNGNYWAFYDNTAGTAGFDQGTATGFGSTFKATVAGCLETYPCNTATISAQFDSSHIEGTRTWNADHSDNFSLKPMATSTFEPHQTAQLSEIQVAAWTTTLSGYPATLLIQADGQFSGSSGGCLYSGALLPMNDFNAFKVTLTFDKTPCSRPGKTTGIAVVYRPTNTTTRMLLAVQDSTLQHGWLFSATH